MCKGYMPIVSYTIRLLLIMSKVRSVNNLNKYKFYCTIACKKSPV